MLPDKRRSTELSIGSSDSFGWRKIITTIDLRAAFATKKAIATTYLLMFLAIVGMGVNRQLDWVKAGEPEPQSFASAWATER